MTEGGTNESDCLDQVVVGDGSMTTEHTIWCDRCHVWLQLASETKALMVELASDHGWRRVKGKWRCPSHREAK